MIAGDPFQVLGLTREATLVEVRAARRRLAFDRHPDRGGSPDDMRDLNAAFDAAVAHLTGRRPLPDPVVDNVDNVDNVDTPPARSQRVAPQRTTGPRSSLRRRGQWVGRMQHDMPSFTIDALPAEAFEALLVVTSWIGEVLVDDPPYALEVHLYEPTPCWCRLGLVPDAGSSTVSLFVAPVDTGPAPLLDDIRDVWVHQLNQPGAFT